MTEVVPLVSVEPHPSPISIISETLLSQVDGSPLQCLRGWSVKVRQDVLMIEMVKNANGYVTLDAFSGDSKITQQPWSASSINAFILLAELIKTAALKLKAQSAIVVETK